MTGRRDFVAQMGLAAAAIAFDSDEMRAGTVAASTGAWDTAWIDQLAKAKHRVVFNGSEIADGAVGDFAATFLDHFHEVHDTADRETRPVLVFRRLGTAMGVNDAMWDRYAIGEVEKLMDPVTKAPARRNIFWKAGSATESSATKFDTLHGRGMISLVCNIAIGNFGRRLASTSGQPVDVVQKDLRANLMPGATLVPSGIYALIRAQNAGCAYMPGT